MGFDVVHSHTGHECRLKLFDVSKAVADAAVQKRLWAAISKLDTPENSGLLDCEFQNVCQRKVGDQSVGPVADGHSVDNGDGSSDSGDDHRVRDDNTFRVATETCMSVRGDD